MSVEISHSPRTFDLPHPHLLSVAVDAVDIDAYQHVNNAVYVTWCDRVAWDHSAALGLPIARCLELNRGMAVVRTLITYLRPALPNDTVILATWIVPSASRLRVRRRFQILRPSDTTTLARAEVEYVCIELSTGRPTRWPPEFVTGYVARPEVAVLAERLASI
jgi:acyl-CoA thioester hydrolase